MSTWITELMHVGCTREWSARYSTMMVLALAVRISALCSLLPVEGWRRGCNYAGWKCATRVPSSFRRCIIHAFYRDLLCFLRFPYGEALRVVIVSIKTLHVIFKYLEIQRSLEFNTKRFRVRQFFILRKFMRNIILFDNNIYKTIIILSKTLSYLLRE